MVLPLIIGAAFAIWAVMDLASYAVTGEDTVFHLANFLGFVDVGPGDTIQFVQGMEWLEFVTTYSVLLLALVSIVCLVFWFSTRPIKE